MTEWIEWMNGHVPFQLASFHYTTTRWLYLQCNKICTKKWILVVFTAFSILMFFYNFSDDLMTEMWL